MKRRSFKLWLVAGLLLVSQLVEAQFTGSYKFPQNVSYSYGRKPSGASSVTHQDALDSYNYWKTNFVTSAGACGYRRVIWDYYSGGRGKTDRSSTVSEGIGYGMLLAAYAGDQSLFDDLWNYYKRNRNGNGVMHWHIENCAVVGANGASDAELDVAMGLIVASYQWQSDVYLSDAKNMIRIIREKEFDGSVLKPGDQFGGSTLTNPSYFSPAYYRVFATLEPSQATFWNNAVAKGYEIILKADKNLNGLVPDWCDANGNFAGAAGSYQDQGKNFIYDAIRTPFRSAVDVLWHGSVDGAKYCSRLTDWSFNANGGGTESLGSKYDINGNKLDASHSNTFVGCFAVAAMAADPTLGKKTESNYQTYLDRGYKDNENTNPGYGQYFNASFKALSQFIMTGNFYLPPPDKCTGPSLGAAKSLCKGSPVALNSGITGATSYQWKQNGLVISGATSATYNATTPGNYEVIVNQGGCVRRSSVEVATAAIAADFTYSIQASNAVFTNTSTGASDYSWSYKASGGAATPFATTRDASFNFLSAGSYDITLTVTNATFGCAGTSTITKKIVVGAGAGWVADDFNDHQNGDAWIANTTNYDALPLTYCSAADAAKPNPVKECTDNPCSLFRVVCKAGAGSQYSPFGITFNKLGIKDNLDISAVPYVSIKLRSTAAVNIGVGLNGDVKTIAGATTTTNRQFFSIAANRDTVIYVNFSTASSQLGYYNATNPSVAVDFTKIHGIEFYPYEKVPTFAGTIDVDWVIVGGKSLPPPQFNLKKDANGFLVYEDPDGDNVYTTVLDWRKIVSACTPKATVTANACSASEVRWFSGSSQIGTGTSIQLDPGVFTVQLINQGGVTTDTVEVVSRIAEANFNVNQENYDVHFINNSKNYNTFTWNYGDVSNDIAGSTKWDVGYHNYKVAGAGTYNTSLTITDTVCKVTKTMQLALTIACNKLVTNPILTQADSSGCEGKVVTLKIDAVNYHAGPYGWFGPAGTTIVKNPSDTLLSRIVTFGPTPGPFSIEAYNDCGKAVTKMNLSITAKPTAAFAVSSTGLKADVSANYVSTPAPTYAWTFGDGGTANTKVASHTFANQGTFNVCLNVSNTCGTATQVCQNVSAIATGLNDLNAIGEVKMYPTIANNAIVIEAKGSASVQIINIAGAVIASAEMMDKGTFDISALPSGMYFVSIQKDAEVLKKRFIKQ